MDFYERALAEYRACRFQSAAENCQRLLEVDPDNPKAAHVLALIAAQSSDLGRAVAVLRNALPRHKDANLYFLLSVAYEAKNELAGAESALREAVNLKPDFAQAYNNLGNLLVEAGRLSEAEAALRQAVALWPSYGLALGNLGSLLATCGRLSEAEVALRRAQELLPDSVDINSNLGAVLFSTKRLDEAEAALRRALELKPNSVDALTNLGAVLLHVGSLDESIDCSRRALKYDPGCLTAHSNLAFALPFQTENSSLVLQECRRLSARHEAPFLATRPRYENDRSITRRLRIGYVSPDFRDHCQSLFTVPLFSHHDREAFEIFCYASVHRPDALTQLLSTKVDTWRDVRGLDDHRLAQLILNDRIDVLIDLTMHMANGRPLLFARRPSPVQVAWLAYPGTTGSQAIGYRFTDPWLDPPDLPSVDAQYSEKSIRLPDTFWCFAPLTDVPSVNALPAEKTGHITFGCLNNPCKFTSRSLQMWSRVLSAVANSELVLLSAGGKALDRLRARLKDHGIDRSRVTFVPYQLRQAYLQVYHGIDMALDTFPSNGHTTSLDAFWMGVPVVTRAGSTAVSRAGLSMLANLEMRDLTALTDDEYVAIAVRLAADLPRLATLRKELRGRLESSPLMDAKRFATNLETAYRQLWKEWAM